MAQLTTILDYLDARFEVSEYPDYGPALNGLQVEGPGQVHRVTASVDISEEVVAAAVEADSQLHLVHHGLFWGGLQPIVGRHYRKIRGLIEGGVALWACHLPLDGDLEFGNGAQLAAAIGVDGVSPFGDYKGRTVGVEGRWAGERDALVLRAREVLGGPVQLIAGGPTMVERVAVLTGSGTSYLTAMVEAGIDTLVTGEGNHHTYVDAHELGVNILYGGHYRTEVFGVRAVAEDLARRFDIDWRFLDFPSGL